MNRSYIVRSYTPADAAGAREVIEATYGPQAAPQSVCDWWSFGCAEASSGFMVAEVGGRVVGVQPMNLLRFTDADVTVRGGSLIGVAVHPDFRRQGIFTALVRACEEEAWRQGAAFVTTMPNERSRPGFLKLGYTDLGQRRLLVRPLDARALVRAAARVPGLDWLAGSMVAAAQAIAKPLLRGGGLLVQRVRGLPANLIELEQQQATHFPGLRAHRTPAWWHWRYLASPLREYQLYEAQTGAGEVVGLAACCEEVRDGLRVAYLMDVAVQRPEILPALVATVFGTARRQGAVAVVAVTSAPGLVRGLCRSGFWAVPEWAPVKRFYSVVRFNPSGEHPVSEGWRRMAGWYQMLGDWDNL